jgi:hypothetical protein
MMKSLIGLVSLLGQFRILNMNSSEKDMLTYAKTEYGNDWQYAFHYMRTHGGSGPRMGVKL